MTKITIFGAGIVGLSSAYMLLKTGDAHDITIVARDLPGDEPSGDWASPWACAGWVALGGSEEEQSMQTSALKHLRELISEHPNCGARIVQLTDCFPPGVRASDPGGPIDWFARHVENFQILYEGGGHDENGGALVRYESVVISPAIFLPWLRQYLESMGVVFERIKPISALSALEGRGHEVLINASGLANSTLGDVHDKLMIADRTWVVLVKSDYQDAFVRRDNGVYTYIFGRGDGTAVVGGVSELITNELKPTKTREEVHRELFSRAHQYLPEHFPSDQPGHYTIIKDLVGIRPLRPAGVRVEREIISGQKVVHAYGTTAGGYIFSFGLGSAVAQKVING
ncbi:hypothetical protein VTH82DRAFT_4030 [Thermothelomyces myriococcoides]